MLVFLDDSGDPGFKLDKGSSSHFVIACVIFNDKLEAEEAALIMKKYRQKVGWKEGSEFKFNKTNKLKIKEVLEEVCRIDFRVRAICVDKLKIYSRELKTRKESFYNYIIKQVLAKSDLKDADIRLDGHAGREYKRSAAAYLRKEVNVGGHKITRIRFVDSRNNLLIQLADLIAGSIHRSADKTKKDRGDYLRIIKDHIDDLWYFQ
ncbi:DUF3800 domain-containing protein [Candidatus Saccharibacteria bacterium]|nr:DUF3800 domain-containing protein [Candidatus Saccharibacteria bacterium]MCL1962904.1 DUF3800 domain-containing protein [Candidatus Saccharibacteria bacterium]